MGTLTAYHPATGRPIYRFDPEAADIVASDEYSDGANRLPGGRCSRLCRTAKRRWVIVHESHWQGETTRVIAVTDADGSVIDRDHADSLLERYGRDDDIVQFASDIGDPLPVL